MNELLPKSPTAEQLRQLKLLAAAVYLCQALVFMLAGLPLFLGMALNYLKREQVKDTWLASHFDWQLNTAWIALGGLLLSGLTFELGIGFFTLLITVVLLIYRIAVGWYALNDDQPIKSIP